MLLDCGRCGGLDVVEGTTEKTAYMLVEATRDIKFACMSVGKVQTSGMRGNSNPKYCSVEIVPHEISRIAQNLRHWWTAH